MNAIVIDKYGSYDQLEVRKVSTPLLKEDEVLVKIEASSINPIDFKVIHGNLKFALRNPFPLIPGHDFAGKIVGVGDSSSPFEIGHPVYGMNQFPRMGAYAGYAAVKTKLLAAAPERIELSESAAVPLAALTALQGLRDFGKLQKGEEVLINGASGGVGTFAVQLAKIMGAQVTGVCSGKNTDLVQSLGADTVIDYHQHNFERLTQKYDLVFDVVGKSSFTKCWSVLKRGGHYVTTLPGPAALLWTGLSKVLPKQGTAMWVKSNTEDLDTLGGYIDTGSLKVIIEKKYAHRQIKEAIKHAETERTVGKLLVKMDFPDADQG